MGKKHYIIPIFVPHEGCTHNCVFCNQRSITGVKSNVDGEYVDRIIGEYLSTIDYENSTVEVSFFGGSFTAIDIHRQNELLEVAYKYKKSGKIRYIHMSTRPDCIDEYILDNLKKYDADIIELGVQSLDEEVLLKSARGHSTEDVIKASKLIKDYGFTLGHQVMLGLPGDNFKKDIDTAIKSVNMKPDICRIYPALVIKGTPMEKMYREGIYKPYTLEQAVEICKDVYGIFVSNHINVIRVGLQPTEEITTGRELVAGPFHPAFRELVEGSIYNDMIREELSGKSLSKVSIDVNPKDISKIYANKKQFFNDMKKQFSSVDLRVFQDTTLEVGELLININEKCSKMSFSDYVQSKYKKGYKSFL
ncbi:elongator complex protein 3 [Haloimpatiens lingqiaonensis]|uniref:elongator complex protein 3 n=1 Tax=Haloimpatiens lingqiaonensis TaxID=1380675 RepID=UPI0010FE5FD4|nr:radical SAM protein [Haloimpatiens lingqiaonensis]